MEADRNRSRGCLLGLAVGDAVGTTVEFQPRGSFALVNDMVGGGPFRLKPGQWTDDTSMALCLATSLIAKNGFDPADQMDRYWNWYQNGYLSSTGSFFDIGNTVRQALETYQQTGNPFSGRIDPYSAGNGSLMRLAPIPLFYFPDLEKNHPLGR
jgi:ADP-ribosyl-[dinitrogen reductase] hydrolase